jgi:hypothetical protein
MREDYAPLQEHFRQIAQTQLIAYPPQHHETHDIGRVLQVIESCAGALVEFSVTPATAKALVSQLSPFSSFSRCRRLTVWTPHFSILLDLDAYTLSFSNTSWCGF